MLSRHPRSLHTRRQPLSLDPTPGLSPTLSSSSSPTPLQSRSPCKSTSPQTRDTISSNRSVHLPASGRRDRTTRRGGGAPLTTGHRVHPTLHNRVPREPCPGRLRFGSDGGGGAGEETGEYLGVALRAGTSRFPLRWSSASRLLLPSSFLLLLGCGLSVRQHMV
ncbi:hypothetical protein BD309DRAFT_597279 [Dichomitus squalens]|nr:hypothetical protein BD309DRAFT_597279 [Dichomitus squalens]